MNKTVMSLLAASMMFGTAGCLVEERPGRVVVHAPVVAVPTVSLVEVRVPPPQPRIEVMAVAPSPHHVWCSGHWSWHKGNWVWTPGQWTVRPHPKAVWVEGRWDKRGASWVWVEGAWR